MSPGEVVDNSGNSTVCLNFSWRLGLPFAGPVELMPNN
jgi:hypothetical protein